MPRFQGLVPFLHRSVLAVDDLHKAYMDKGQRGMGQLVLLKITSSLQQARAVRACVLCRQRQRGQRSLPARVPALLMSDVRSQILLQGVKCCPARGASCLTSEHTWGQLMPAFAALVRSLCVLVEAWPRTPGSLLFPRVGVGSQHSPQGLQCTVRPALSACFAVSTSCHVSRPPGKGWVCRRTGHLPDDRAW